jgi:hypothetical protein
MLSKPSRALKSGRANRSSWSSMENGWTNSTQPSEYLLRSNEVHIVMAALRDTTRSLGGLIDTIHDSQG